MIKLDEYTKDTNVALTEYGVDITITTETYGNGIEHGFNEIEFNEFGFVITDYTEHNFMETNTFEIEFTELRQYPVAVMNQFGLQESLDFTITDARMLSVSATEQTTPDLLELRVTEPYITELDVFASMGPELDNVMGLLYDLRLLYNDIILF